MPDIELSEESQLDPTHTLWIIEEFEEKITKLFEDIKPKLTDLIPREIVYEHKIIKKGSVDLNKTLPKVDKIFDEMKYPANRIIEVEIPKAYNAGGAFGSIQLGGTPEQRAAEWTKISDRILKTQSDFKGITDETAKRVRSTIADGILNERQFKDITRDIVRGVDGIGINRATIMARTETMEAVNAGVKDRYRSADVKIVEWLAAADERTCPECGALDMRKFEIEEAPPCPKHPQCRCTLKPIIRPKKNDKIEKWTEE